MSVQTRAPGGGWTTVAPPVDYAGVVSGYSAALKRAQTEQENTEIESKVLDYRRGLISYAELQAFLNARLAAQVPGSARELDIRKILYDVEDFENEKKRELERARLEQAAIKDGISAEERADIEEQLLEFYKEGTVEYSEQLTRIAQSKELARQEENNIKLAQLQARLSEGGLTTGEEIEILREARDISERGSEDWNELTGKINLLKEQKREEDLAERKNQRLSELMDQFVPGGITNSELLLINRDMQQFETPGTEGYIDLKQGEAEILNAISREGVTGGVGTTGFRNEAITELERLESQLDLLEGKFSIGAVETDEYLAAKQQLINGEFEVLESLGDEVLKDRTLSRFVGEHRARAEEFMTLQEGFGGGEAITVVDRGKRRVVLLSEAKAFADMENVGGAGEAAFIERPVITAVVDGEERKYAITEDGKFELLAAETRPGVDPKTLKSVEVLVSTGDIAERIGVPGRIEGEPPGPERMAVGVPRFAAAGKGGLVPSVSALEKGVKAPGFKEAAIPRPVVAGISPKPGRRRVPTPIPQFLKTPFRAARRISSISPLGVGARIGAAAVQAVRQRSFAPIKQLATGAIQKAVSFGRDIAGRISSLFGR